MARAAILATTDDEIEVVPRSVSAAPPELELRSMPRDGTLSEDEPDEPAGEVGGPVEVGLGSGVDEPDEPAGEGRAPEVGLGVSDMVVLLEG